MFCNMVSPYYKRRPCSSTLSGHPSSSSDPCGVFDIRKKHNELAAIPGPSHFRWKFHWVPNECHTNASDATQEAGLNLAGGWVCSENPGKIGVKMPSMEGLIGKSSTNGEIFQQAIKLITRGYALAMATHLGIQDLSGSTSHHPMILNGNHLARIHIHIFVLVVE